MSSDTVKLTVQIQTHDNRQRFTIHSDIPLEQAATKAEAVARRLSTAIRKEAKEQKAQAAGV